MEILKSTNYDEFRKISGNRLVNRKKVSNLIQDVKNGLDLFQYCPIVVSKDNDKYLIVDGQHRYEACKELNKPIHYVICDSLELKDIARLNSRSDKWKNRDFLECYIQVGLKPYDDLLNILTRFKISYTTACSLLAFYKIFNGGSYMEDFRNGQLQSKHLKKTMDLLEFVENIFGRYKFCFDRGLIHAVMKIQEKGNCDFEVLKQKIKSNTNMMEKKTTYKEYCNVIELVYNQRNQKRISIY